MASAKLLDRKIVSSSEDSQVERLNASSGFFARAKKDKTGKCRELTADYPDDADGKRSRISILPKSVFSA
jgi:hypothetical protein